MRRHISAGIGTHARGSANRRLAIGVVKEHATRCQFVYVRRFDCWMTGAAQIIESKLVAHYKEHIFSITLHDIFFFEPRARPANSKSGSAFALQIENASRVKHWSRCFDRADPHVDCMPQISSQLGSRLIQLSADNRSHSPDISKTGFQTLDPLL